MHPGLGLKQTSRPASPSSGSRTGWAPADLRVANQWSIYSAMFSDRPATVPELAAALQVTKPTVSAGLAGLEQVGLINHAGIRKGAAGRAPHLYAPDPRAAWIMAVEIGRQWLRIALADLTGAVVARKDIPTTAEDHSPSVTKLADEIQEILAEQRITPGEDLVRAVVASPGVYDPDARRFFHNFALPALATEAFIEELRGRLGVMVHVENDANSAALGELAYGKGHGVATFVYLHVGVGVGLGVVVDGALHRGAHGAAGEPLFMNFASVPNGPGLLGNVDGDDLVSFARKLGDAEAKSAEEIVLRVLAHDELAEHALNDEIDYLAAMLVPIVAIVDPETVIFGGTVGELLGPFLPRLRERIGKSIPLISPNLDVSALGPEAVIRGIIADSLPHARRAAFERQLDL